MPFAALEFLLPPGLLLIAAAYAYVLGRSASEDPKFELLQSLLRRCSAQPRTPVRWRRAA